MANELSGLLEGLSKEFEAALLRLVGRPHRDTLIARMDVETNWHTSPETEVTVTPTRADIAAALQCVGSRYPASRIKLHLHPGTPETPGVWLDVTGCDDGWAIGLCRPTEYLAATFPVAVCASDEWVSWFAVWDVADFRGRQVCRDKAFAASVVQHFAETGELSPDVVWQSA